MVGGSTQTEACRSVGEDEALRCFSILEDDVLAVLLSLVDDCAHTDEAPDSFGNADTVLVRVLAQHLGRLAVDVDVESGLRGLG